MSFQPSFHFPEPDHFTVGTVGPPGKREFYLQAGTDGMAVSFKLEKQQVAALAEYLGNIMADLPAPEGTVQPAPPLIEPVVAEWVVGGIGIAVDEGADRILLVIHELVREEEPPPDSDPFADLDDDDDEFDEDSDAAIARLRLTRNQVAMFIERAHELIASGRPLCPFCGLPDGPDGHFCPRAN